MNAIGFLFAVIGIWGLAKTIIFTINIYHANASIQKQLGDKAYKQLIGVK